MENKNKLWREITSLLDELYSPRKRDREANRIRSKVNGFETEDEAVSFLEGEKARLQGEMAAKPRKSSKKALPWLVVGGVFLTIVITIVVAMVLGKSQTTNATASSSSTPVAQVASTTTESNKNGIEPFEVAPYGENPGGKMIPGDVNENAFTGELDKDVAKMLYEAEHRPEALKGYAKSFGLNTNLKEWMVKKDSKTFLSEEAQALFFELKATIPTYQWKHTDNVGVNGYSTGIVNGEFVQNANPQDYTGWSGWIVEKDGTYIVFLDWCGNGTHPNPFKGVPKKELPTPPKPPTPPTPPSNPPLEAKNQAQEPASQGNAPIGGGQKEEPGVQGPADNTTPSFPSTYQAPSTTPSAPAGGNGGGGINNSPHGSFQNPGGGNTVIDPNGGVTTPSTNYDPLVGQTPPPVQNQDGNNSGINQGSTDPNNIPVED